MFDTGGIRIGYVLGLASMLVSAVCCMRVLVLLGPGWMHMELSTLLTTEETMQEV